MLCVPFFQTVNAFRSKRCFARHQPGGPQRTVESRRPSMMRAARFLLALVAALPLVSTLGAAARAEQASFHMYGAASGLLQSGGFCMLSDGAGFLYACTEGGLYSFDGQRFTGLGADQGLPAGREVQELALTDAGRIAVRYHDGVWIADEAAGADRPPSALHFRPLPLAVVASRAAHDVARWPGGLVIAEGDQVHLIAVPVAGPASVRLLSLPLPLRPAPAVAFRGVFNLGGDLWMFRSDGKACVWNRSPRCFGLNDGLPAETWLAAAQAPDGTILLRAPHLVASLAPGQAAWSVTTLPAQGDAYGNYLEALDFFPTAHDGIATQADHGIDVLQNGRWRFVDADNSFFTGLISASVLDRNGSLWLQILGQGVARWNGFGAWQTLTHADGLSDGVPWETARTDDGSVWLATDTGTDQIVANDGHLFVTRRVAGASYSLAQSAGLLWGSNGEDGGLRVIDPATADKRILPLPNPIAITAGAANATWIGTTDGLFRCSSSNLSDIACTRTVAGFITDVADDGAGGIFYATRTTLNHLAATGGNTRLVDHWPLANFNPMALARAGSTLWVGGGGGLLRVALHGGAVPRISVIPPANYAGSSVVSLLASRKGWLWIGTDAGLSVFDGSRWVSLDTEDGLLSNDLDERGLREDPDGTIWITSSAGLSHLLKPDQVFAAHDLDVVISRVLYDDHLLRDESLPYSRKPLTIDIGTPSYPAQQSVVFRYRLAGVDEDWIETSNSRVVYPFVPPGRHQFTVYAYDRLKHRISQPRSLTIAIAFPWWRQWWAETLWTLSAIGIIYGVVRLRMRVERARQAELERRVEEVTAEIRQAQAALAYQATHDQLTGLLNRSAVEGRLAGFLQEAGAMGPDIVVGLADIDHFKAINDGWGHLTGDSVLREMGALAAGVLRAEEFAGRYGGEEVLVVLRNGDGRAVSRLAEFHQRVRTHSFSKAGTPGILNVTCSIGMAAVFGGDTWESLIGRADRALYHAKRNGRDRIAGLAGFTGSNDVDGMPDRARSGD